MKNVDELITKLSRQLKDIRQMYPYRGTLAYVSDDVLIDILRYLREYRLLTGNVPPDEDLQYKYPVPDLLREQSNENS